MADKRKLTGFEEGVLASIETDLAAGRKVTVVSLEPRTDAAHAFGVSMSGKVPQEPVAAFLNRVQPHAADRVAAVLRRLGQPFRDAHAPWVDPAGTDRVGNGDSLLYRLAEAIGANGSLPARVWVDSTLVPLADVLDDLARDRHRPARTTGRLLGLNDGATVGEAATLIVGKLRNLKVLERPRTAVHPALAQYERRPV